MKWPTTKSQQKLSESSRRQFSARPKIPASILSKLTSNLLLETVWNRNVAMGFSRLLQLLVDQVPVIQPDAGRPIATSCHIWMDRWSTSPHRQILTILWPWWRVEEAPSNHCIRIRHIERGLFLIFEAPDAAWIFGLLWAASWIWHSYLRAVATPPFCMPWKCRTESVPCQVFLLWIWTMPSLGSPEEGWQEELANAWQYLSLTL